MMTLIFNEIKKLLSRKKTIFTIVIFAILLGLIGFGEHKNYENQMRYNSPEFRIKNLEESLSYMKKDQNNTQIPEEARKSMGEQIARMEEELKLLKEDPTGKTYDWKKDLQLRIQENERMLKEAPMDARFKGDIELIIQQDKYLLEHNIKPEEGRVPTINAIKILKTVFMILGTIFLAVGVTVFTADMVSGECTPPTLKFLLTQPVSRTKVLLSKFIAVVSTSIVLILAVELLSFLVMGLIFGFGNFDYPVLTGARFEYDMSVVTDAGHPLRQVAGSAYMITSGVYLIRLFLMQILFIFAACSFAFMLSTIFKSSMISVTLSIVSMIGAYILQEMRVLGKLNMFMFTSYSEASRILSGNIALQFNNPGVNINLAIIVLAAWTIICYAIANIIFVKKDILI